LQTRSVRVHGSSRHLTGDVRAIEITSYNTIHLIVQPGDAKSRRRCDLTPPPGTNLEYAFSKLRPAVAPEALGADDETVALVDRMNTMLDPKEPRATKLVHSANRADQRAEKHAAKFFRSQALRMEFIREIADHLVEDAIKASLCNAVMLSMWLKRYGTRSTLPLKMLRTALIVDAQLVTPAADGVHYLTEEGDTYLQQLLEERTKLALRQAESQRVIARRAAIVAQRNRDRAHQKYLASEQALAEANQRLADAESELTKLTQGFGSY
ncbi:MAG TPA: hypothetical protein VLA04_06610, partial [Verrucomicrobiae bacterium]|nr:hypothetical protein [Verrucomicrobiae bacterium]